MTSRIRCSCGRVYDPQKHTHCPECGAESAVESVVVAEKVKSPAPVGEKSESRVDKAEPKPGETQLPSIGRLLTAVPWPVYAGAAVLLVLILAMALRHKTSADGEQVVTEKGKQSAPAVESSPTAPPTAPPETSPAAGPSFPAGMSVAGNLSDLVGSAAENATVKLRPGLYKGGAIISRPVHIVGEAEGQVFIQGETKELILVRSKGVVIENVQMMFTGSGETPAISVAENGELELDGSKVTSNSSYGLVANGGASVKGTSSTFSSSNGTAAQFDRQARGNFTKCNFTDAQTGLKVANASNCELHSCAFERNGSRNGRGAIMILSGDKTVITADQCRFATNPAGIDLSEGAALTLTNSSFKDNGVSSAQGNWIQGLVQVKSGAGAKLENNTFESNGQGISAANGGNIEIDKCRFNGTGLQTRGELIPSSMAICGSGQGTTITVRNSTINTSASYAVGMISSGRLNLEETEISGARTVGLLVGDRKSLPATAEAKHCHFVRNTTGVGVCAASSAIITDSECRENSEGAIALDRGTRLNLSKTMLMGNREHGVLVYGGAQAEAMDCQIENNGRGGQSGMQRKPTLSGSLSLQDCRVARNQMFGVGAYAKSQLTLTRVTFEANGKTNVYKESGAIVQTDGPIQGGDASATSDQGTDNQGSGKRKKQRRQSQEDARDVLRRIFRP